MTISRSRIILYFHTISKVVDNPQPIHSYFFSFNSAKFATIFQQIYLQPLQSEQQKANLYTYIYISYIYHIYIIYIYIFKTEKNYILYIKCNVSLTALISINEHFTDIKFYFLCFKFQRSLKLWNNLLHFIKSISNWTKMCIYIYIYYIYIYIYIIYIIYIYI